MVSISNNKMWTKLGNAPEAIAFGKMLMLNESEFLCVSEIPENDGPKYCKTKPLRGIYKYNVHTNQWSKFFEYPVDYPFIELLAPAIDAGRSKIYISSYLKPFWMIMNVKTGKISQYKHALKDADGVSNGALINVNGVIHLIGGQWFTQHLIWDDANSCFNKIYDFKGNSLNSTVVYAESKQMIFLVSGQEEGEQKYKTTVWTFCVRTHKWRQVCCGETDGICLSSTLSSDENFIIISAGFCGCHANYKTTDSIYVIDIRNENNYTLHKSSIKSPITIYHDIVRTGGITDELMVIGWIKRCFNSITFNDLTILPMYLMQLITVFYGQEEIHWIKGDFSPNQHYAIKIKHILSSIN